MFASFIGDSCFANPLELADSFV